MDKASSPRPDPGSPLRQVLRVTYTFVSMSGWRLDHLNIPWVVFGALSIGCGKLLMMENRLGHALAYYLFTLFLYYGANTWLLVSKLPGLAIERYGEDRAYRMYETLLALMFINQGMGVGCITSLDLGSSWVLPGPSALAYAVGGALFAAGLMVKVWSTVVLGVDVYYYRDMFVGHAVAGFVARGPYKAFRNPMYGIGQLHAYGYAALNRSVAGLLAAAVCHALIYVFYFVAERPFVQRVYLAPRALQG